MMCQHCGSQVVWDVYGPGPVDPDSLHTVCLWCGAMDSQRTDQSDCAASSDVKAESEDTYNRRRRTDLGLPSLPKKQSKPRGRKEARTILPRRGYSKGELAIITDRTLSMGQVMRMLAKAGYERTYNAVAIWRSTHKHLMVVPKEGKP